jgi:RimJ/RimL family protein N-acetyltransferase
MIYSKKSSPVFLKGDIPDKAQLWRNSYEVRQWCRQHTLIDIYAQHEWVVNQSDDPKTKMFGIACFEGKGKNPSSTPFFEVGVCGLTSIDFINRNAEFSLYIAPQHQRRGYGKKALELLIKHGFEDWNLERIWGETFDKNPARKTFEALGMKKEGTLERSYFREGTYINSHIYAILKDDYFLGQERIKLVDEK